MLGVSRAQQCGWRKMHDGATMGSRSGRRERDCSPCGQSRQAHQGLRGPNSFVSSLHQKVEPCVIFHCASLTETDNKSPNELSDDPNAGHRILNIYSN